MAWVWGGARGRRCKLCLSSTWRVLAHALTRVELDAASGEECGGSFEEFTGVARVVRGG